MLPKERSQVKERRGYKNPQKVAQGGHIVYANK